MLKKFWKKIYEIIVFVFSYQIEWINTINVVFKKNKKILAIVYIFFSPIIIIRFVLGFINEITVGKLTVKKQINTDKKTEFDYSLAIVAILKNESPYILEWIEFHHRLGVEKFYIYDNESTDDIVNVLSHYIDSGLVEYKYFPGKCRQLDAYNDAISNYKNLCKYMGFIDLDEFIIPADINESIFDVVEKVLSLNYQFGGIGINWLIYGSAGHVTKPSGGVLENYLYRSDFRFVYNYHIKTVCNPRLVNKYVSPHYPIYKRGAFSVDENGVRLYGWYNHHR